MEPKQQPPYPLRMPQDMRTRLEEEASDARRSLNAHLVAALQERQDLRDRVELLEAENEVLRQTQTATALLTEEQIADLEVFAKRWDTGVAGALERLLAAGMHPKAPQVIVVNAAPGITQSDLIKVFEVGTKYAHPHAEVLLQRVTAAPARKSKR